MFELLGAFMKWMFETPIKGEKPKVKNHYKW